MANLLNDEVKEQVKQYLTSMVHPVTMVLFTKEGECQTCKETRQLLNEVSSVNDKITVVEKDIDKDSDDASAYHLDGMVPSFVLLDHEDAYTGIKFNGIPAGHEINSFLNALLLVSGVDAGIDEKMLTRIKNINKPVNIKVFVTLSCPHCPGAVSTAHKLAMSNANIEASMVEAQTFMELSRKHNVTGVPKIVFNDSDDIVGNQPLDNFVQKLEEVAA